MSKERNITFNFNFHAPVGQNIAHVDKLEAHFDKDMTMQVVDTHAWANDRAEMSAEPLHNHIFQHRIFDTNERLIRLRNVIASAIDMGDATSHYGKPQETRIHPNANNEWYYILKAIKEASVAKDFTSTSFIEQMGAWFPMLFPMDSPEVWEEYKRKLSKSISAERSLWKYGAVQEEIPLKDMWAKQQQLSMDAAKMNRIYAIAYKGLYLSLLDLKDKIAKEKSR